jgi:hypothetical protein
MIHRGRGAIIVAGVFPPFCAVSKNPFGLYLGSVNRILFLEEPRDVLDGIGAGDIPNAYASLRAAGDLSGHKSDRSPRAEGVPTPKSVSPVSPVFQSPSETSLESDRAFSGYLGPIRAPSHRHFVFCVSRRLFEKARCREQIGSRLKVLFFGSVTEFVPLQISSRAN